MVILHIHEVGTFLFAVVYLHLSMGFNRYGTSTDTATSFFVPIALKLLSVHLANGNISLSVNRASPLNGTVYSVLVSDDIHFNVCRDET